MQCFINNMKEDILYSFLPIFQSLIHSTIYYEDFMKAKPDQIYFASIIDVVNY